MPGDTGTRGVFVRLGSGDLPAQLARRENLINTGSPAGVVRRDLGRYYGLIDRALARLDPPFSEGEACLVLDALNGYAALDDTGDRAWWMTVYDAMQIEGLARKWDVGDPDGLIDRLRKLDPTASLAILDRAELFWAEPERDTRELLAELGLVR